MKILVRGREKEGGGISTCVLVRVCVCACVCLHMCVWVSALDKVDKCRQTKLEKVKWIFLMATRISSVIYTYPPPLSPSLFLFFCSVGFVSFSSLISSQFLPPQAVGDMSSKARVSDYLVRLKVFIWKLLPPHSNAQKLLQPQPPLIFVISEKVFSHSQARICFFLI